jgi:hypothetical protein
MMAFWLMTVPSHARIAKLKSINLSGMAQRKATLPPTCPVTVTHWRSPSRRRFGHGGIN